MKMKLETNIMDIEREASSRAPDGVKKIGTISSPIHSRLLWEIMIEIPMATNKSMS